MCLWIPSKVVKIDKEKNTAQVDTMGVAREVGLDLMEEGSVKIGDYVLMGGEIPAMVAIETISRLVPGVVGKEIFLKERVKKGGGFTESGWF